MTVTEQPLPHVEYGHVQAMDVHFDDLDSQGLVHNTRYPVMVERALNLFWTPHGFSFEGGRYTHDDVFLVVAEIAVRYRMPIRGTGRVAVHLWADKLGGSSLRYGFRFLSLDGSVTHAEGHRVHIHLDPQTLAPSPWSDATREVATSYLLKPADPS